MDGAVGLIRVAFDFSVWPIDGRNQNSAGSSNIFTSADACQGSTCIPWFENMTAEEVVTAVVSHVLYNVARTSTENNNNNANESNSRSIKLRKEWSKVLRLALVVDHAKGTTASVGGSGQQLNLMMTPAKRLLHAKSLTDSLRKPGGGASSSSTSGLPAPVSSLVIVNPTVPLRQQPSVIQSVTTSGTIKTLETAVVVLPYDEDSHSKEAAEKKAAEEQKQKELIIQATSEDLNRKLQVTRNRDEQVRKHSDKMRNSFNAQVLGHDVSDLAALVEKQKATREKKEKLVAAVDAQEEQWRRDLVTVEQSLSRLNGRIDLFQREKEEIEQMIQDLYSSTSSSSSQPRSYF